MRRIVSLLAVFVTAAALILSSRGSAWPAAAIESELDAAAIPRVDCERPGTLRLHRFEDRSAWLECAGRILVRVSVPG